MLRTTTILLSILVAISLTGCGYDRFDDLKLEDRAVESLVNTEIGVLIRDYNNAKERRVIYDDVVIGGYVTANDRESNFFRTFTIQDHSGAMEVRAGGYSLHNLFVEGRYIVVKAQGLSVGLYNEVLQIGVEPSPPGNKSLAPEYIGSSVAMFDRFLLRSNLMGTQEPVVVSRVADLDQSLCGQLIVVDDIELVDDDSGSPARWALPYEGIGTKPGTGYPIFTDSYGEELAVVTSGYASFAGELIPHGRLSIRGILSRGKSDRGKTLYLLKMRSIDDVQTN